ncbi:MAG TPA: peptidoglycan-binding domain-containing protein [Candidatus Paceibacterota bacterium]|nr:peptidoglycan-binding domain-containing protein [Candidatus Paceibacterota bacterium]
MAVTLVLVGSPVLAFAQYGGGGPPVGLFGLIAPGGPSNSNGNGKVLGASTSTTATSTPAACKALLTQYMREGKANDPAQVTLLQTFLSSNGFTVPISGFFGPLTTTEVKAFQSAYAAEILAPWGITQPTGYVYKTTLHEINKLACPTLTVPFPTLP